MSVPDFRNRTDWLTPALALGIWAAHFSLVWAASSIFPDQPVARWIAAGLTLAAIGVLARLWRAAVRGSVRSIPGLALAFAGTGVVFDALPAIVG